MDAQQLRDEVVTLFFAGFETTARSLTWAWYLLSLHPDIMARVAAEADAVLGGRTPTAGDLYQLTYTRMVIDETLRLYPPTALLARQNVESDEIGGYPIPPDSMVTLIPYLIHRHPSVWDDPERFDPERFTKEASSERPKYAYIPFASGPRVCLGNNFALLEMTLALSMTLARYSLAATSAEPIEGVFKGTLVPKRSLVMRLSNR
jgi:cytochrome P450